MAHEDEHLNRVIKVRMKMLDLLAAVEDDKEIFPDGLPEDPEERLRVTSMLNADTLGSVLACGYMAHFKISPQHAEQWMTEVLTVLQKTIQRDLPHHRFDWSRLRELGEKLWDFSDEVPDTMPEDL